MTPIRTLAVSFAALAAALAIAPAATAQTTPPGSRPVVIQSTAAQQRFRQTVQQNQVRDQLQKNQLDHQLRQQTIENTRHRPGTTPANDRQVDQAEQSQDTQYNAQQRDRVQRYSDALMAQPVPAAPAVGGKADDKGH